MRRKYKWMNLRPAVRLLGRDDGGAFSISKGLICMAKFCPNCGKQLKDTDVFCTSCGKKFPQKAQPVKPRVTAEDELRAARDILCGMHLPDYSAALGHMDKAAKLGGHDGTLEAIVRMLGAIESLQAVAQGDGLAKPHGNVPTQKMPGQASPSQPQQGGPLPIVGNHGEHAAQQGCPLPTVGSHGTQYGGAMPFAGQQSRNSGMSAGKAFAAGMAGAVAGSVLTHALSGNSSRAEASPSMHTTRQYTEPDSYDASGADTYTDLAGTDGLSDGYDGSTDGLSDGYDGGTDEFSDGYDGGTDGFSDGYDGSTD